MYMATKVCCVPRDNSGEEIKGEKCREYIYFKVKFNNFRDVSRSSLNEVIDKEEINECECVLALLDTYS